MASTQNAKMGLSSPLSLGSMLSSTVHEDTPSLYNKALDRVAKETKEKDPETNTDFYVDVVTLVKMVDVNNEIYQQFRKRQYNVYMVFNKTELRKAVPEPSLLSRAELHLLMRKHDREQLLMLFERRRRNSWHYFSLSLLDSRNTSSWVSFDVTEVVQHWLNKEGPFEVFGLIREILGEEVENVLHMDVSGITPNDHGHHDDNDNRNRPMLFLLTRQLKQAQPVNSTQHP